MNSIITLKKSYKWIAGIIFFVTVNSIKPSNRHQELGSPTEANQFKGQKKQIRFIYPPEVEDQKTDIGDATESKESELRRNQTLLDIDHAPDISVNKNNHPEEEFVHNNNPPQRTRNSEINQSEQEIFDNSKAHEQVTSNQRVKRKGELMIPANGECLFTSILLGYLVPVLHKKQEFENRCILALGKKESLLIMKALLIDLKKACKKGNYFEVVQKPFFSKNIIQIFRTNMGIELNLWGGLRRSTSYLIN